MKILIFGRGQIGQFYLEHFSKIGWKASLAEADITKPDEIAESIKSANPEVVINTAAKTNLEWCDKNKLEAFEVNVLGANNIADICDRNNIYFVHLSSGCIFSSVDENDIKNEQSIPNPEAYYAWTKVWAEEMVKFKKSTDFKCLILRPRQPVSAKLSDKNMLVKMLTFSKFVDTPNSGTVIEDFVVWSEQLIKMGATGIYHLANQNWTTPYQIALKIKKYIIPDLEIEKISKDMLNQLTPNYRVDTVLDISKLLNCGISVSDYDQRLEEIIKDLAANIKQTPKTTLREVLEETARVTKTRSITNNQFSNLYSD